MSKIFTYIPVQQTKSFICIKIYYLYHLEAVKETTGILSKLAPMMLFSTGNKILIQNIFLDVQN